jgi:ribosomal protein L7/L12
MRGELIEAIRIVRTRRRIGLKDAKEAVDAYLETQPSLARSVRQAQANTRRRALAWLTAIVTSALALYYLFVGE